MPLLLAADLSILIKGLLALIVVLSAVQTTRRHLLFYDSPISREVVLQGNELRFGDEETATIAPGSYVHRQLVVLNLILENGKRHSLILFPDALDTETFHRLQVKLRFL